MFSALRDEELVQAKESSKEQAPFTCPACTAPVLLKKGSIKAPHFADLITTGCEYERGEGQLHHRIKAEICAALAAHPQVSKLQQERRRLREVSPDISFCLNGRWYIAIELQVSDLAISTIQRRVEAYTARGIALLWVLPYHDGVRQDALYRSTRWERYLHALYRKKLYYWMHDETLQPVTYHDITTTGEDYQWYDNQADWFLAGQPQRSRTRKRIELHPLVKITDLVPVLFPAWDGTSMSLPEARLWTIKPGGSP